MVEFFFQLLLQTNIENTNQQGGKRIIEEEEEELYTKTKQRENEKYIFIGMYFVLCE